MNGGTATINIADSDFTSTTAAVNGGVIYSLATGTTTVNINTVSFRSSTAASGGVAFLTDAGAGNI